MNDPTKDLSELAAGAHREAERQLKPQPAKKPPLSDRTRGILAGAFAAGAVIVAYGFAGPYVLGYSDHTLRKELVAMVAAARDDVESARKQKGDLPATIANVALAMVVEYHRSGSGYRLVANDGKHMVEMDDKGSVSESKVAP
jgi:hypothetical protein